MNLYIKIENGVPVNHPMLEENLQEVLSVEHPVARHEVTEEFILAHGYAKFERTVLKPSQYVANPNADPVYEVGADGVVREVLDLREMTQEEKVNAWVRSPRNYALAQCDWTQMPDAPLSPEKKAAWAAYRQELRDMTVTYANIQHPAEIVPPQKPE